MRTIALALLLTLTASVANAQTLRPRVRTLSAPGGQRGTTITTTLVGPNLGYGSQLLFDAPGITVESLTPETPPAGAKNPENKLVAKLKLAPDAPLGRHAFRVMTALGPSEPAYFVVGQWPEASEVEPNNTAAQAQALTGPVTVTAYSNGGEDIDYYKVTLQKGETCVFEAAAGSLGSPLEPTLTLFDSTNHELAVSGGVQKSDAVLVFTAPASGTYLLRVRDLRYQGSGDHLYRLTVGTIPYVQAVFPLGGTRGTTMHFAITGANLPAAAQCALTLPSEQPLLPAQWALPLTSAMTNVVPLDISTTPEAEEVEPNDKPAMAVAVSAPVTVNGRIFGPKADTDCYRFKATKGQAYELEVLASRLGSKLDGVVTVLNAQGQELAGNDDARGKDPFLVFTAPDNAEYIVRVTDLNERSGPDFGYRLRIVPTLPDFSLTFAPDCPAVGPGDLVPLTVTANRAYGFGGAIDLAISGLPAGLKVLGTPQLAAGQNEVTLLLTADPGAAVAMGSWQVSGRSGKLVHRAQSLQEDYVKRDDRVDRTTKPVPLPVIGVIGQADLVVTTAADRLTLGVGKTADIVVRVVRKPGITGKLPLLVTGLPAGVSLVNPEIPENKNEHTLTFKAEGNAAVGEFRVLLQARSVVDELRFSPHAAPPLVLTVAK